MSIKKFKLKFTKNNPNECIECDLCTKHCDFLTKHDIHLKDFASKGEVADECCTCEQCYNVCPEDISGADIAFLHRKEQEKSYKNFLVKLEKESYIFQNNSEKKCEDLIFFGCNFPGYYPKTTKFICENICDDKTDFSIDCCGKPLLMAGMDAKKNNERLKKMFQKKGVKRLITACPNCYSFLGDKLGVEVVSIYVKLHELGLMKKLEEEAHVFFPCSERNSRKMFDDFKEYIHYKESFLDINCCGGGGGDKTIAQSYPNKLKAKKKPNLYVYCATCGGIFGKNRVENIHHFTSEFLGICEKPSKNFLKNVTTMKLYKRGR